MEQTIFDCKRSSLARCWLISVYSLFTLYLIYLPLAPAWSLAFPAACVLLGIWDYFRLNPNPTVLIYRGDGSWCMEEAGIEKLPGGSLRLNLRHRNPMVLIVDVFDRQGTRCDTLLVWRDSLGKKDWRQLLVCLGL